MTILVDTSRTMRYIYKRMKTTMLTESLLTISAQFFFAP
jgi:hypothetical protein